MSLGKIKQIISHYVDVFYNKYYLPQILFQRSQRRRLKNKDFSLLCGNCMGGYIYHQLGLKFTSPTINMMITNPDFMKLVMNPQHYMQLEPVPCVYLPVFKGQPQVGLLIGKTLSGKWRFEKYFDFVEWVNSEDKIAQHFYIG